MVNFKAGTNWFNRGKSERDSRGERIDKRFRSKGREVVILSRFRDDEAFAVNGLAAILVNGEHDNAIKYR